MVQAGLRKHQLIGKICVVHTMEVTATFGQAEIDDGEAGILIQVRCERLNDLKRGSTALVYDYDREAAVFLVSPKTVDHAGTEQPVS